jgi:hypothetical protein
MAKKEEDSARRLFDKLGAASAAKHVFTGMIKPAADDESIMFAQPGDCSKWIKIAASHVEDIEFLHVVNCEGHTHPLVQLFMKEPGSAEGKTFAALAQLHSTPPKSPPAQPIAPHLVSMAAGFGPRPGSTPCYWDWALNRWVCPPFGV